MTAKILAVEDDQDLLELLTYNLENSGYRVFSAGDGLSGLNLARDQIPDLIILDVMLPIMNGLDVCRSLKRGEATKAIPVLMLTAKGEEIDRVVGFEIGAEDYVIKPFSIRELLLRIKAILRRAKGGQEEVLRLMEIGSLRMDLDGHRVWVGGQELALTVTEFKLLRELAENRGRVLTRERLLDRVWGYTFEGYGRTVDTHIRRVRKKLGAQGEIIETVRGIGYRLRGNDSSR
ncbi:MAG: response regulator transcription factor [Pseudomonadota bacterium]